MKTTNHMSKSCHVLFSCVIILYFSAALVLGRTISARPGKIVAGQEPEKTNELLQALGEAIGKKVSLF